MRWFRVLVKVLAFLALFWLAVALVRVHAGETWASVLADALDVFL